MTDAKSILLKVLDEIIEKEDLKRPEIDIIPISTEGANYTTVLFLAKISSTKKNILHLFAKVANIGDQFREAMNANHFYRAEKIFYEDIMKAFNDILHENNVPQGDRIIFPKFYKCHYTYLEETIVLENLSANGYIMYDRFKSVDWQYAAKAIEEIAKFHALSFAFKIENPEQFHCLTKDLKNMFSFDFNEQTKKMFEVMKISSLNAVSDVYRDRFLKFADSLDEVTIRSMYEPQRLSLLIHGDYRPSNILVKYHEDHLEDLVAVDYQTIHIGSPINDLLYFIFCGSDGEFRKKHYQNLIDHYYDSFNKSMKQLKLDCDKLYPRADFDADLRERLIFGLFVGHFVLPIVLVDSAEAPVLDGSEDIHEMKVFSENNLHKERLNSILEDFERWGLL